ncbi:MAG: aquaporin [Chloroflexi bacterium]|nr:aquaporin [Chloroflexota bacterium]MBI3340508.1 aquaporin [Chloroflexota bacterium]
MFNSKVFVAELIGTFALTFFGAGAGVAKAGLLGVALAHGIAVLVFVYAYGHISGAHVNPAVTFGLALNGAIKWGQAIFYWIAQFLGAVIAAFALNTFTPGGDISGGATVGSLTGAAPFLALTVEALLAFFLVNTVLHTAVAGKGGNLAGVAIGLTLTLNILAGGPLTGASFNPARTFGPALFTGAAANPMTYVIYFIGPLLGAAIAAGVFKFLNSSEKVAVPVPAGAASTSKPAAKKTATRRR